MTEKDLLDRSREALEKAQLRPAKEHLQKLIDQGVIDEGGKVQFWDAFLAIIAIKPSPGANKFACCRCLKPAFGMPGTAEIDISRDSLASYIQQKKQVITAYLDERQKRWKMGEVVHLTSKGYLRTDPDDVEEDNLGELPHFKTIRNRM